MKPGTQTRQFSIHCTPNRGGELAVESAPGLNVAAWISGKPPHLRLCEVQDVIHFAASRRISRC